MGARIRLACGPLPVVEMYASQVNPAAGLSRLRSDYANPIGGGDHQKSQSRGRELGVRLAKRGAWYSSMTYKYADHGVNSPRLLVSCSAAKPKRANLDCENCGIKSEDMCTILARSCCISLAGGMAVFQAARPWPSIICLLRQNDGL